MSDAAHMVSRDEEMLARLAELDLAAAEKAHAKLMAAEESAEIAEMSRAYQRMSRSLRQTLAIKARLAHQRETRAAKAPGPQAPAPPFRNAHLTPKVRAHIDRAAAEVLAYLEQEKEVEDFGPLGETEIYEILIDLAQDEDFLDTSPEHLTDLVLEVLDSVTLGPESDPQPPADPTDPPPPEPALEDSA